MVSRLTKHKRYDLDQSPLYKVKSQRKLAGILNSSKSELHSLAKADNNYKVFYINKGSAKERKIEIPKYRLEKIHRRLFILLQRIKAPSYLHSGVKGKSYITNAREHIGSNNLITLDISKFFPSTRGWHVFDFYRNILLCSQDVAWLLTRLSTYDDHVPTGSCLSQSIAFYAHFEMFQEIDSVSRSAGNKMTCYVDDITISGIDVNRNTLKIVRDILVRRGLRSNYKKERVYTKDYPKEVTGSIVAKDKLLLPNKKHKKIHEEVELLIKQYDSKEKLKLTEKLIGKAIAASQSDSNFYSNVEKLKQEKNRLTNLLNI